MTLRTVLTAAFLLALTSLTVIPARAEELKPLPELDPAFNLAAYAQQTDTIKKDFAHLPGVAFEIALPKAWIERSALGDDFGELARFDSPPSGDLRSYFSLKRIQVRRENTARLELVAYMLKQGYVLRSLKEIDERRVDALYVVLDTNGDSFAVRAIGRMTGPSFVLAEYAVPVELWDEQRDQQTFAMRSFKFTKDTDDTIEKRVQRNYFNSVKFIYPGSWIFDSEEAPAENIVHMSMSNVGDTGLQVGRIRLTVLSARSLKDEESGQIFPVDLSAELKGVRSFYESQKFILGKIIESKKPVLNVTPNFSSMDVYHAHAHETEFDKQADVPPSQELWLAVFRTGEGNDAKTYIADMFTPTRESDIYLWSINTRAFELFLKSIQ